MLLRALAVCRRFGDVAAVLVRQGESGACSSVPASGRPAVVVGLSSTEGFGSGAVRVLQQLPLLSVLVHVPVLAAVATPRGWGPARRSGQAEEGRHLSSRYF